MTQGSGGAQEEWAAPPRSAQAEGHGRPILSRWASLGLGEQAKGLIAWQDGEIERLRRLVTTLDTQVRDQGQRLESGDAAYKGLQQHADALQAANTAGAAEYGRLRAIFDQHGGEELVANEVALATSRERLAASEAQRTEIKAEIRALTADLRIERLGGLHDDHPATDSIALQGEVRDLKKRISDLVRAGSAVETADAIDTDGRTLAQRRAATKKLGSLALRGFNAEADAIIAAATARNGETSTEKLYRAADQIAKLVEVADVHISRKYIDAKARELNLAVRFDQAKAFERELEKERRAELREQARAERELEAERARLTKEMAHYENILEAMRAKGDDDGIARMQDKIDEVQHGIEDVDQRAANIRAGYVYVISNVGAFGDHIVKIGMTRRLDPMDRVRELGDASVPFGFDVHALFFSEDAVAVEAELHRRFAAQRVNRVNLRREFFHATPAEVRDALKGITGDLIEFREDADAEQFRESLQLAEHGREAREQQDREAEDGGA